MAETEKENQTYRVEGFSCVNCAGKFERNVKKLPNVEDAKVNFGASKISVVGRTTIEELEKAGAFENLKIIPEEAMRSSSKTCYNIEGFSCANCAGKFERNVKELPNVQDAKVNFGASKISVTGEATIEELERAGAFENLKVTKDQPLHAAPKVIERSKEKKVPFYIKHSTLIYASLLIVLGYTSQFVNGEQNLITILLFLVSIVIGGFSLFKVGLQNLTRFDFDMKTLMTVAVIGAAIIGQWSEAAVVVILFAISEALERFSMEKARKSIRSLMNIAPREAIVLRNGHELIVPVEQIKIGDIMIVKPGQKIAMDGVVVKGNSSVNQAAITGESVPVTKTIEDEVFAGTLNGAGVLEVRVTKYVEDTTISKIIHLVEEAQGERAPSQAFVDKFAKYYTPIIMMIALFVVIIPPLFFGASFSTWLYQGLSILVVGCPCALVISTPITIVSAIGNAAKKGVLIKGGNYLEEMGSLKAIAFDKTGTLTKGVPVVTDFEVFEPNVDENEVLALIAALENRSQHPLASAILQKVEGLHISYKSINVENFSSITGKGVKGFINQLEYLIGSPKFFEELQVNLSEQILAHMSKFQSESKTVMFFGTKQKIIAILAITDIVREQSEEVITKLHEMGIKKTVMLTGDNIGTANSIGQGIGISEIRAELMPEEKLAMIKNLRKEFGKVAMIGDGVNDAPALAASNVGIAMGGAGTDTALETADVALMADDLRKLPFTIKLSRSALNTIKANIAFAILIKLAALILVIPGWLTLWIAIMSDMGATLIVALNGLRMMKVKE